MLAIKMFGKDTSSLFYGIISLQNVSESCLLFPCLYSAKFSQGEKQVVYDAANCDIYRL